MALHSNTTTVLTHGTLPLYCAIFTLQNANPPVATYYTNRALCYIMLRQWALTVSDCQKAIQIEPTLIKAHFFMGQALTELENYDDAISSLIKGEVVVVVHSYFHMYWGICILSYNVITCR